MLFILKPIKINKSTQIKQLLKTKQPAMSSFTTTAKQSRSQEEQKQFVVPSVNRWTKVSRPQQQVRQNRRPQQQVRQNRRPQQQGRQNTRPQQQGRQNTRPQQRGRQLTRPQFRGRQSRRPYNNRRRKNYRKKQLGPQKGTRIATGSLLDMAMIINKDGSKSVKVQCSRNGKRVIQHASLNQVLKKKIDFKVKDKSNNSFSVLDEEVSVGKIVPRPTIVKAAAPQGRWGAPLNSKVKQDEAFKYESGSQLEKQHLERLSELEEEKFEEREFDRQIRTGQYKIVSWADAIDSDDEDEDDFQENRKLGEGSYDQSFQPDVDDEYVEDFDGGMVERSWATTAEIQEHDRKYNHQAEIQTLDGWYD